MSYLVYSCKVKFTLQNRYKIFQVMITLIILKIGIFLGSITKRNHVYSKGKIRQITDTELSLPHMAKFVSMPLCAYWQSKHHVTKLPSQS